MKKTTMLAIAAAIIGALVVAYLVTRPRTSTPLPVATDGTTPEGSAGGRAAAGVIRGGADIAASLAELA